MLTGYVVITTNDVKTLSKLFDDKAE